MSKQVAWKKLVAIHQRRRREAEAAANNRAEEEKDGGAKDREKRDQKADAATQTTDVEEGVVMTLVSVIYFKNNLFMI